MKHEISSRFKYLNQNIPSAATSYILVAAMFSCITFSLLQVIERMVPGWHLAYLVWMSFLACLLSIFSAKHLSEIYTFRPSSLGWMVTEIATILITLKLIQLIRPSATSLSSQLIAWQENFIETFFTPEYIFASIVLISVWAMGRFLASLLFDLEENRDRLDLEKQGIAVLDRNAVRKQLMGWVFGLGGFMLVLTTFNRLNLPFFQGNVVQGNLRTVNILLYFLFGFLLLGQSQMSLLKIRWYLAGTPVRVAKARYWLGITFLVIFIIGGITIFLPTDYSIGLLTILRYAIYAFTSVLAFLQMVLLLPLGWLLSLINQPVPQSQPQVIPQFATPAPQIPSPTPVAPPWIEVIKSIIFWLIFIIVIFLSIVHFIRQRQDLFESITRTKAWAWIYSFWQSIRGFFSTAIDNVSRATQRVIHRIKKPGKTSRLLPVRKSRSYGELTNREKIIHLYRQMIDEANQSGLPRKLSSTPLEYNTYLDTNLPDGQKEIDDITSEFIQARYTTHSIEESHVHRVQYDWNSIRELLKRLTNHK